MVNCSLRFVIATFRNVLLILLVIQLKVLVQFIRTTTLLMSTANALRMIELDEEWNDTTRVTSQFPNTDVGIWFDTLELSTPPVFKGWGAINECKFSF